MQRQDFSDWSCSLARASNIIGDGWSPLILRDVANGIQTFSDLQRSLEVSKNTLTQRLNGLLAAQVLERELYHQRPNRYRYVLTPRGSELVVALLALSAWADKWVFDDAPPYRVKHRTCGHEFQARVRCSHCGDDLDLRDVETVT